MSTSNPGGSPIFPAESDPQSWNAVPRLGEAVGSLLRVLRDELSASDWAELSPIRNSRRQAVEAAKRTLLAFIAECARLGLDREAYTPVCEVAEMVIRDANRAVTCPRPCPGTRAGEKRWVQFGDCVQEFELAWGWQEPRLQWLVAEMEGMRQREASNPSDSADRREGGGDRGGQAQPSKKKKFSAGQANEAVADYLKKHAPKNPQAITIRELCAATRVPQGTAANTPAWKAFVKKRKQLSTGGGRTVQFSPEMLATIPNLGAESPAEAAVKHELAAVIEDQRRDDESSRRRSRPRS